MLTIAISSIPYYDELSSTFLEDSEKIIHLEHSLISLSKWECLYCKPFISSKKTNQEIMDYIRLMIIDEGISPSVLERLTNKNLQEINQYIESPMTATTINDKKGKPNREIVTAELIYCWMVALNIPFECQYWHLNRLLTFIQVCNIKQNPPKKMSAKERNAYNRSLNQKRRQQLNTKG